MKVVPAWQNDMQKLFKDIRMQLNSGQDVWLTEYETNLREVVPKQEEHLAKLLEGGFIVVKGGKIVSCDDMKNKYIYFSREAYRAVEDISRDRGFNLDIEDAVDVLLTDIIDYMSDGSNNVDSLSMAMRVGGSVAVVGPLIEYLTANGVMEQVLSGSIQGLMTEDDAEATVNNYRMYSRVVKVNLLQGYGKLLRNAAFYANELKLDVKTIARALIEIEKSGLTQENVIPLSPYKYLALQEKADANEVLTDAEKRLISRIPRDAGLKLIVHALLLGQLVKQFQKEQHKDCPKTLLLQVMEISSEEFETAAKLAIKLKLFNCTGSCYPIDIRTYTVKGE